MNIEIHGLSLAKAREMRAKVNEILRKIGLKNKQASTTIYPLTETEYINGQESPYFRFVDKHYSNSFSPYVINRKKITNELSKIMNVQIMYIDDYISKKRLEG